MKITSVEVGEFRKAAVAVAGAAAEAVNFGLVTGGTARWVGIIIGAATAAGVFAIPNGSPTAPAVTPVAPVAPRPAGQAVVVPPVVPPPV